MTDNFTPPTKCLRCSGEMEKGLGITKDMAQLSSDYVFSDSEPFRDTGKGWNGAARNSWAA